MENNISEEPINKTQQPLQAWHAPRLVELSIRETESGQNNGYAESSATYGIPAPS
jgi:hypothetical protein